MWLFPSRMFLILLLMFLASAMLIACGGAPTATPAPLPTLAPVPTNPPVTLQPAPTAAPASTATGTTLPSPAASVTTAATGTASTAVPSASASITATVTVSPTVPPTATARPSPTPVTVPTAVTEVVLKTTQNPQLGTLLTDAQGMTLYTFKNDQPDASSCTGDCATLWPPLTIKYQVSPAAAPGIPGSVGVFERLDNTYQVAYNDLALYRYSKDTKPGDTNGNGLNGLWSVVVIPPPGPTPTTSNVTPLPTPTAPGK